MTNDAHEAIEAAIAIAVKYGGIDGDHHKTWVIDQMVRALTGCPVVSKTATDVCGYEYTFEVLGESAKYIAFVREACAGEDGPNTYDWDVGIAP